MTDKVHHLRPVRLENAAAAVLADAQASGLTDVVVVGYKPDGTMFFGASMASGPEALWLLESAKHELMSVVSASP